MHLELPKIRPEERTPLVESLLGLMRQLLDRVQHLEETVQQLRDDNARLKGQQARPTIRPSALESPPPRPKEGPRPGSAKCAKQSQLRRLEEVVLLPPDLPPGAVLKGYEPYVVQELTMEVRATRYLRARFALPGGGSVLAPLPSEVRPGRHFGPALISYILNQYHHAHVTQPLLLQQLRDWGIVISAGQLNDILTEDLDVFHQEKAAVLVTGLQTASYLGVDDTAARHRGQTGACTAIGNDLFAYFESSAHKGRLNFLQVLHGEQRCYAINEVTLAYWERQGLTAAAVAALQAGPASFAAEAAWQGHLAALGITGERPVRSATEGALLGGLIERGVSPALVVLSDGAAQFDVLVHASCWVHAERPLARMVPYNEEHRALIEQLRTEIWELYQGLKAYRQQPDAAQKPLLEARFDALCGQQTGYPRINAALREMRDHRADLLRALERPEVPLHNNAAESDIREYVKKRKISGSTRSDAGRRCRDTFTSLKKTCRKLGVNFWDYLQDRIRGRSQIPALADLIRQRAAEIAAPLVPAVPV
jgi:hypothetical protein